MSIEHGSAPEGNPTAVGAVTKAVTVDQPYASLIAHGVKTWETRTMPFNGLQPEGVRGLPGCKVVPGERIAIHASQKWDPWWRHYSDQTPAGSYALGVLGKLGVDTTAGSYSHTGHYFGTLPKDALPLGAVLATVVVGEALSIFGQSTEPGRPRHIRDYFAHRNNAVIRWTRIPNSGDWHGETLTDQFLFGHWLAGNWAMELLDVERLAEPIACKGSQGVWRLERAGVVL